MLRHHCIHTLYAHLLLILVILIRLPSPAHALSMGEIHLLSNFNQPLEAEIELLSIEGYEPHEIRVQLGSEDLFKIIGIERTQHLTHLNFSVIKMSEARGLILVTTQNSIKEPYLNFAIQVQTPSSHLIREYSLLLDPAGIETNDTVTPVSLPIDTPSDNHSANPAKESVDQASKKQESEASALEHLPLPKQPVSKESPLADDQKSHHRLILNKENKDRENRDDTHNDTYIVKKNDTLSKIAQQIKPDDLTLNQTMIALQQKNKEAFINGNINLLKEGATLIIPSIEAISNIPAQEADLNVAQQATSWKRTRSLVRPQKDKALTQAPVKTNKQAITAPNTTKRPEGVLNIISVDEQNQEENSRNPQTSTLLLEEELDRQALTVSDLNQQLKDTQEELKISEMLATLKDQQTLELEQKLKALQAEHEKLKSDAVTPHTTTDQAAQEEHLRRQKTHTVRNVLVGFLLLLLTTISLAWWLLWRKETRMRHATAKKRTKPVITDNQLKRAVDDAHDHIDHTDHTDYIIETNDPDNINRIRA